MAVQEWQEAWQQIKGFWNSVLFILEWHYYIHCDKWPFIQWKRFSHNGGHIISFPLGPPYRTPLLGFVNVNQLAHYQEQRTKKHKFGFNKRLSFSCELNRHYWWYVYCSKYFVAVSILICLINWILLGSIVVVFLCSIEGLGKWPVLVVQSSMQTGYDKREFGGRRYIYNWDNVGGAF